MQRNQNHIDDALRSCQEALKTYRELAQKSPDIYKQGLSRTLLLCGIIYHFQGRVSEARSSYQETLAIYESLAKQNPQEYEELITAVKELLSNLDKQPSPPDHP